MTLDNLIDLVTEKECQAYLALAVQLSDLVNHRLADNHPELLG